MAGESYESNDGCIPLFLGIVVFIMFIIFDSNSREEIIKSRTKIEPTIELILENQKIDTLYVYKKSK